MTTEGATATTEAQSSDIPARSRTPVSTISEALRSVRVVGGCGVLSYVDLEGACSATTCHPRRSRSCVTDGDWSPVVKPTKPGLGLRRCSAVRCPKRRGPPVARSGVHASACRGTKTEREPRHDVVRSTSGAPACTHAIARQAGGHWFEPSSAHSAVQAGKPANPHGSGFSACLSRKRRVGRECEACDECAESRSRAYLGAYLREPSPSRG